MDFKGSRERLENLFIENRFKKNTLDNNRHTNSDLVEVCSGGSEISVLYPGYKAEVKDDGSKVIFDYRVDLDKDGTVVALSHSNIVADIYNKIVNGGMSARELSNALIKSAIDDVTPMELDEMRSSLHYSPVIPSSEIISKCKNAHGHKYYNENGNSFDLNLDEFFTSIKWIAIQEDINYPIGYGKYGRRMAYCRYIEACYVVLT